MKLKDIADIFTGINYPPKGKDFGEGNTYRVLNVSNITDDGLIIEPFRELKTSSERNILRYLVRQDTVLVSSRGTKLKIARILDKHEGMVLSSNLIGIDVKHSDVTPEILEIYLRSVYGMNDIMAQSLSGDSMLILSVRRLGDLILPKWMESAEVINKVKGIVESYGKVREIVDKQAELVSKLPDALMEQLMGNG